MSSLNFNDYRNNNSVKNAWLYFIYFWIVFLIGTFLGQFVPPGLRMAISVVLLIFIVITLFVKASRRFGFIISNIFALAMGIISFGSFSYYLATLGTAVFYQSIGLAVLAFALFGVIGYFFVKDASGWNKFLFPMLVVLIFASILGIFIKTPIFVLIITILGLAIFLMYTIYDFNRMRQGNFTAQEMGFNLFINLLNIIMDVLRLASIFRN